MSEPQVQAGSRGGSSAGAAAAVDPAAEAAPQLLPYQLDADGRKQPLPGVQSVFLRSNTAAAMGLADLSSRGATPQLMAPVPKEKLLADVQFQGAISDFHPIREFIKAADYDPLLIRVNEDDLYGDGNNYEVACSKAAADIWVAIEEAAAAAAQQAAAADDAAAGPGPKPRQLRPPRPWEDQGTEAELAATLDRPRRDHVVVLASRPRREFGGPCALGDASAQELWQSNTMECRPFKDAAYDLKRQQLDGAVQAVAAVAEVAVQATGARPVPGSTQYVPQSLSPAEQEALLTQPGVVRTIERAGYRCEEALLQNNVTNIFADDLATLADEEVQGAGGRQDGGGLAEAQSFTDLLYSKNKVVSAVRWVPGRRGVIAVACTDPASYNDRLAKLGRPSNAYILVWNVRDPIHPEYVLESPHEVFCFEHNPANPNIVSAGCYNGQLVVWDTTADMAKIGGGRHGGGRGARASDDGGGDEATTPVIRHQYMSAVEFSHTTLVADLTWLPGIEIDRQGKVYPIRAGSAGTGPHALARSQTLGAAAMAAAAAGSHIPRGCCFIATCAGDGKVLFWDVRVDKLVKKGTKRVDTDDLVWRPMHVVHLLSSQGMDFAGARLCFDLHKLEAGEFLAGSGDGEILLGTFIRPPGSDNPDYCQLCHQPHAGPIVALARSPFFEDLVVSVGDWSFRLWRGADSTQPIYTSPYAPECYTAGCWSPTRPGVLFLANAAGCLAVWDFLDRSHEPCLAYVAAPCAIMSLAFAGGAPQGAAGLLLEAGGEGGAGAGGSAQPSTNPAAYSASAQLLALGDAAGVLHLLELPRTLRRPLANERKHMAAWLGREAERVGDAARRKASRKAGGAKPGADAADAAAAGADASKDVAAAGSKDTTSGAGGLLSTTGTVTGTLKGTLGSAGLGGTLRGTLGAGGADAARQLAEDQALEKAEKVYKAMEAEFKAALGLIPASGR